MDGLELKGYTAAEILCFDTFGEKRIEMEAGAVCLWLYEGMEETLRKNNIRISLNLIYEGPEIYICVSKSVLRISFNTILYCLSRIYKDIDVLALHLKLRDHKAWITLYVKDGNIGSDRTRENINDNEGMKYALKVINQYIEQYSIQLFSQKKESVWEIGFGFDYSGGGVK